jgi:predicted RNase H-like nuclease (RuvC/YqgF family)
MYKLITTICFLFATITLCAQTPDSTAFVQLQQQVDRIQIEFRSQKADFSKRISSANEQIKSLQDDVAEQKQTVADLAESLGRKINETAINAETLVGNVETQHATSVRWSAVGGVVLLLLSVVLFAWLYLKRKADSANLVKKLEEQKSAIETKLVKEYSSQTEALESLTKNLLNFQNLTDLSNSKPDHSLALKLADEITLMERNITLMDSTTKGLKQLNRSISKLKDNLAANGYEIPELLNKPYDEGLKCHIVNTIQDENLEQGVQMISKIIKPQAIIRTK